MADPVFTPAGAVRFEQARHELARRRDVEVETVTDADVQAFLAAGATPARSRSHTP